MTALEDLLAAVAASGKRLVVYADEDADVAAPLATRNVDVERRPLPADVAAPFVVVEEDGEFVGAIALADLESLLEPPVVRPVELEAVSRGYRAVFDVLDDAVYTRVARRSLLAVSREIEERASRVGAGTLRASFQSFSKFEPQVDEYRRLGERPDLDVHVHADRDWEPPTLPGVTYHEYADDSLAAYWALAYETGDGRHANALLARETDDGYDGFWTDDADRTGRVMRALEAG